jgi:hypothetical protein
LHTLRAEQRVEIHRRELLRFATVGLVAAGGSIGPVGPVHSSAAGEADLRAPFDVGSFGATSMLRGPGGLERTETKYRRLLDKSGFHQLAPYARR